MCSSGILSQALPPAPDRGVRPSLAGGCVPGGAWVVPASLANIRLLVRADEDGARASAKCGLVWLVMGVEVEQARPPAILWVSKPMTRPDRRARPLIIPIPAAAHAAAPAALTSDQCRSLLNHLPHITDPRQRRGRRHPLVGVLGILRAHGHRNIAAALRYNARDATRVLPLLGIASP